MIKSISLILLLFLASCSSNSLVKITSNPKEASVKMRNLGDDQFIDLGTTPLVLDGAKLEEKKFNQGPVEVILLKDDYVEKKIILTSVAKVEIDLSLELEKKEQSKDLYAEIDRVASEYNQIQKLIRVKKYQQAKDLIQKLKESYSELSVIYELEGSIYYLQKQYEKSLDSFKQAYIKNSKNKFALRMKQIVERQLDQ